MKSAFDKDLTQGNVPGKSVDRVALGSNHQALRHHH